MRVLVVTLPDKAHYSPLLGPAAELARRGHDVTFTCPYDIAAELTATGHRVKLASSAPPPPREYEGEKLAKHLFDPVSLAGFNRKLLVDAPRAFVEPLREVIRAVKPDVMAIDTVAYAGVIAAELEKVPWVGWSTTLGPVTPDSFDSRLVRTLRLLDAARSTMFASHDVTPKFRVMDVLSPRGTAVFATEALTGPSPTDDVQLVGPSLGGTRGSGHKLDLEFATGRPIVLATFGGEAYYQPARYDKLFEAAASVEIAIVCAMGPLADEYDDSRWVRCVKEVDIVSLMPRCAVTLHHGGSNTVMEACAFGVPQIVAPIYNDQPHNARFVTRAGCGVSIDLEGCQTAELVEALQRLLAEGDERIAAREIATSYLARPGSRGAADLVERAATK
jgi:UDP:flavonoid glycosyltransferase YjiC (YdhE family)